MPDTITVGLTVNLESYCSLRVDVEGKEGEDEQSVVARLDKTLAYIASLCQNDVKRDAIERERKGVLGGLNRQEPKEGAPKEPAPQPETKPMITEDSLPKKAAERRAKEVAGKKPAPEPKPKADPAPAAAATPADGEAVCEACGAPITKSQEKLSNLFTNKSLCKKCMEAP